MRRPRIVVPGIPMHIVQRGNNQQHCFSAKEDYIAFLEWLREYSHLSKSNIHAYVLMPNHVHFLATPQDEDSISILMKRLGQRYVQFFNRKYNRSGTLWEGRYKSCIVEPQKYLLDCCRYIETHPVRAGLATDPGEYPWSSYGINGQGET
ncbi:transposase [Desulfopila sp. IMCC35008]|uniref:transposase n=1 Tax=Desulfopila sp. IMCC35008 TaxID=2653858 RepID=UPI00197AA5B9|nr:transposase [Desulfopila sp. IMCC35008]